MNRSDLPSGARETPLLRFLLRRMRHTCRPLGGKAAPKAGATATSRWQSLRHVGRSADTLANLLPLAILLLVAALPAHAGEPVPPPSPRPAWDWQLSPPLELRRRVDILDIDPDLLSASQVRKLRARGTYMVCYVSVGTWERWRRDSGRFPRFVLGRTYEDWPDERFLDIRRRDVLLPIMRKRFRRCAEMGFQAIEADNIDIYEMNTGFPLTREDALAYARALADAAHALGLAIAQKNAPDIVDDLVNVMDFAVVEECFSQNECKTYLPWRARGRPVLVAEYALAGAAWLAACRQAETLGFSLIRKNRDLTGNVYRRCPMH